MINYLMKTSVNLLAPIYYLILENFIKVFKKIRKTPFLWVLIVLYKTIKNSNFILLRKKTNKTEPHLIFFFSTLENIEIQSHYCTHFQTNTNGKTLLKYVLNSTNTVLFQGWFWYQITHKG